MKKLKSLFFAGLAISTLLFYPSCTPDEGIIDDIIDAGPSVGFLDQDPSGLFLGEYPTGDFEVSPDIPTIYVAFEAVAGSSDLKVLTIKLDGTDIEPNTFSIRNLNTGADATANNPYLLLGDDTQSISYEIGIPNDGSLETKNLSIVVEDVDGMQETISISFNSFEIIESTIEGVLLNRAGPAGQGGLDLDEGTSTGTVDTDPTAALGEIKDEGIDISLPNDQNWKSQISGMNDAEIRTLSSSVENFDFDAVTRIDEIKSYFDNGDALPNTNSDGEAVSDAVNIGDVFTVSRDDKIYLIEVTDVIATASDNNDAIEFRIKH